jgi:hypothetical protein
MRGKITKIGEPMPLGLSALAAMHAADEARGIEACTVELGAPAPHAPTVVEPTRFPEPDWEQERLERLEQEAAERRARAAKEAAELESVEPPPQPTPPAPKRRSWHRYFAAT